MICDTCSRNFKAIIALGREISIDTYINDKISNSTSSKALFNIVNQLSGKLKSSINIGLSNAKESAEKFSLFFIEKIAKIRDDLDNLTTSLPSYDEFSGSKLSSFNLVSCEAKVKPIE